ncbi:MAG: hypothetical protein ABFC77_09375 [Thermoguttaceae bacterium]
MKIVLLKDNHTTGSTTLAHPLAKPGQQNSTVTVKEIRNVPDEIPPSRVAQLWNRTCDMTWLGKGGDPMSAGRFVFDFSELGEGLIIRS